MSEQLTVQDLMERMPKAFLPEKAGDLAADIQFHFEGKDGGDWVARIHDGACTTEQGSIENARLTLTTQGADYLKLISGELNPMAAFAQGKIKLKGDLSLALKLMDYFKLS